MNITGITGNLTADPEVQRTNQDVAFCRFAVAVRRPHSTDKTDFIKCMAWRQSAELLGKHFHKGDGIGVDGHLETNTYEDRDGNKRSETVLVAENISFTSGKKSADDFRESKHVNGGGDIEPAEDEDLPF